MQWETFSDWLLTFGLVFALVAFIAWLVDVFALKFRPAWPPFVAATAAAVLSLFNACIHSRDGYTAVAPSGVLLSAIVTLILVLVAWNRWSLTHADAG